MYATIQEQVEILAKSNVSSKQAMNEEAAEAAKEKVSFLIAYILLGCIFCYFSNSCANLLVTLLTSHHYHSMYERT
jgi:predicted signal transduction protein with EAL and GGDEF domain